MPQPYAPQGFTLIELLVVITIIVVLLALLAPALDKAVHQAQLAACGAQMGGMGAGLNTYAAAHKRFYPAHVRRFGGIDSQYNLARNGWDMRVLVKSYMAPKIFLDPLAPDRLIDYSSPTLTTIEMSYGLWFGWAYPDYKGVRKMGDRVEYLRGGYTDQDDVRVNILVSDIDLVDTRGLLPEDGGGFCDAAHPDRMGVMTGRGVQSAAGAQSEWRGPWARPPLDLNFLYGDGAVLRLDGVKHNADPAGRDERVVKLQDAPAQPTYGQPARGIHLPKQ